MFKTVKDLMNELNKMDPNAPALFYWKAEISGDVKVGYSPYNKIYKIKVIKKTDDWYEKSNNPEAIEVIVITDSDEL